jgi:phosphatidylinositol alpha-1,6-mannosyltransferase
MGGGIARWMGELARRFPPGSLVVSTGRYGAAATVDQQFPNLVDRVPISAHRLRTVQGTVVWSRRAVALAGALGAEFVWCGNLKPAAYPARWVKQRLGTPYGILLHGGDLLILRQQTERSGLKRRTAKALLEAATILVTNSQWTAELCRTVLQELGLADAQDRLHTVPLGTDPMVFRPGLLQTDVRSRYDLHGRRWLLSVARLTYHKGIDTGLAALAGLTAEYPDLGYIVVGSGDELETLQKLAGDLAITDRVRFLTGVPDSDLPGLYNCAAVYLGLSRLMNARVEGFGISLVEAAACGIPVLATRSGGIPEAVQEGESGLLVDSDSPDQVCASLRTLLSDHALAQRLGAAGRRAVERYYNWDRVTEDIAQLGRKYGRRALPRFMRP